MLAGFLTLQFCIFIAFALPVSVIDIRSYRIPDVLSYPCFVLILAAHIWKRPDLLPAGLLAAGLSVILFLLVRAGTNGLGMGDVKFAASVGLLCGIPGACTAFLLAALSALALCLCLRCFRKDQGRFKIPFAPFLSFGGLGAYLLHQFF
jgi:prepilin signal peptidase PulO-like enzyme (type II secretory pathway)